MTLVVVLLAYVGLLGCAYLIGEWTRRHDPAAEPLPRRMTGAQLRMLATMQLLMAAMLLYTYSNGAWTAQSVGLPGAARLPEAILLGFVAYLALIALYVQLMRSAGALDVILRDSSRANLRVWPRGAAHKRIAALFIMVFNPFTEELVMRGILIHHWGGLLGSPVVPILVGFVLNAVLHAYQGWRMQLWHALFFTVTVSLLYSRWGLAASIAAHFLGDVLPLAYLRHNLRLVRAANRRRRLTTSA